MIAGGFAQAYTFKDPLADLRRSPEQPAFGGSETTDAKFDIRSGLKSGGTDFGRGASEVNISFGIENDSQTIGTTPDGVLGIQLLKACVSGWFSQWDVFVFSWWIRAENGLDV